MQEWTGRLAAFTPLHGSAGLLCRSWSFPHMDTYARALEEEVKELMDVIHVLYEKNKELEERCKQCHCFHQEKDKKES